MAVTCIDNALMQELVDINPKHPNNIFFVCDAMIGQSAVQTAKEFDAKLDFTGFILTKDGDARGGRTWSSRSLESLSSFFEWAKI